MNESKTSDSLMTREYQVLHEVAQALQVAQPTRTMLQKVLEILTQFDELKVEHKAGLFLADEENKVLRLYTTIGGFSDEFLEKEKEVPYGDCLCGRVAESGELLMSEDCFTDTRHERRFTDMTAHGHYIVPLKSRDLLVGVLFLYTNTHPSWYQHSQEVLLSIGGLIADAILRSRNEEELAQYRDQLEERVRERTHDLEQVRSQLRNLSHRLQSVREEEKARLAREVHDELGQDLTALKLDLAWMERRLAEHPKSLEEKIGSMSRFIDETIGKVQKISTELRPAVLDVLGLAEALKWQTREFQNRTGLNCELTIDPDPLELDQERSTALFRIYQETLTNIIRHAKADSVHVQCRRTAECVELIVMDNGCGVDPEKISDPHSLGLVGIRERALACGGEITIEGQPGAGTTVTARLPLATQ